MALEQELETFDFKLPELRATHEGEFALIHGREILGVFPTYKEAIEAGKEKIGFHARFLVSWIAPSQEVALLSPHVVTRVKPERRSESEEEVRARICREQYVLKVLGLLPFSSQQT